MATEWFYTTNKTQMGPVSWKELHELAEVGILKPHDLVWSEGMDEWVKAINQKGLFTEDAADEKVTSSGKKVAYAETKPPPGRRTRRRDEDEEEDDEEDSKEKKRKARKREEDRARTGVGVKVALILGAAVFVLLLMVCGGGGLIWLAMSGGRKDVPQAQGNNPPPNVNPGPGPAPVAKPAVVQNYAVQNLFQGQKHERMFQFQAGRRVVITSNNNLTFPNTDVDLYVFRRNQPNAVAADIEVPERDRNCRVEFVVPATDTYIIRLVNLGPGMARNCNVTIEEH